MTEKIPDKWSASTKTVKAMQVAFEMEQHIATRIREMALESGLTPSDQIRKLIGLSYSPPKRPRLTVSLTQEDYEQLGKQYQIDPTDNLSIRRMMMQQLTKMVKGE